MLIIIIRLCRKPRRYINGPRESESRLFSDWWSQRPTVVEGLSCSSIQNPDGRTAEVELGAKALPGDASAQQLLKITTELAKRSHGVSPTLLVEPKAAIPD
jgi:hypothetical protein